jgi:hypothetical protein
MRDAWGTKGRLIRPRCIGAERPTQPIYLCNTVPPVFIFPRARLHDSLMLGAPSGSLGLVNRPQSSWITGPVFLKVLEHVKNHTRISKEDHIILLMDSHECHRTLDSILCSRENGITLVTSPLHCFHRLQPLDVGVMGPFK